MPGLSGLSSGRVSTCSGTRWQPARGMSSQCRSTASARCSSVGFFWPGRQRTAWKTGTGEHPGPPPVRSCLPLCIPWERFVPQLALPDSSYLSPIPVEGLDPHSVFPETRELENQSEPVPCLLTLFSFSPSSLLAWPPLSWAHMSVLGHKPSSPIVLECIPMDNNFLKLEKL